MAVDKVINLAPDSEIIAISDDAPDIEVVLEEDGSATVEVAEDNDVDFYSNLAEILDPTDLSHISIDLLALFEADSSSREDWKRCTPRDLSF